MAATNDAYVHCRNEWIQAYNEGPHTSFLMFRDVMRTLGLRASDVFRDPTPLDTFDAGGLNDQRLRSLLDNYTWGGSPGRCTTFALRVARRLQRDYPGDGFEFEFFDLGKHRVARCRQYGFVIDSESRQGIELLPDDDEWISTPAQERGRWRYYNNHSVFEDSSDPNDVHDVAPISASVALAKCLEQVAKRAVLICLFRHNGIWSNWQKVDFKTLSSPSRSMEDPTSYPPIQTRDGRAQFHGSIRWRLKERRIELMPDIKRQDEFATITFGPQGNPETNRECAYKLVGFIRKCGIERQWKSGSIDKFNKELWGAAIKEWGYPVYRE